MTQRFVDRETACRLLACRIEWINYVLDDQLVSVEGDLIHLQGLHELDNSDFMIATCLAAARYGCSRQRIDALIRMEKLRVFRQGSPGKRPAQLVYLKDVVGLLAERVRADARTK